MKDLGNNQPVSLKSVLGKVLKQTTKQSVLEYLKKVVVIAKNQHELFKNRSCPSSLIF